MKPRTRRGLVVCVAALAFLLLAVATEVEAGCGDIKVMMTEGDGYAVVFGPDGKLYNSYHHVPVTINCNDPLTGELCEGYPPEAIEITPMLQSLNWTHLTGERDITLETTKSVHLFVGPQFLCLDPSRPECFEYVLPTSFLMSTKKFYFGIVCFDIKTKQLCASHPVTILNPVSVYGQTVRDGGIFLLTRIGDKLYSLDSGVNILCYDTITHKRCDGFPRSLVLPSLPPADPIKGHVDFTYAMQYLEYKGRPRFYVAVAYGAHKIKDFYKIRIACFDFHTFEVCPEFKGRSFPLSTQKAYHVGDIFFEYDRNGEPISVCSLPHKKASVGMCRSLEDPTIVTGEEFIKDLIKIIGNEFGSHSLVRHENRLYIATGLSSGVHCYDFTTRAGCPGFPTVLSNVDENIETNDYAISLDPSGECFFSLGHNNVIYTFDSQGNAPCRNASRPQTRSDFFTVPDSVESTLDVLLNDEYFAPSTLKIIVPPSSPHISVVDGKIIFTPTQTVDRFEYQVCSPGFGPATSSASVTVRVCRNQNDENNDGIPDCLQEAEGKEKRHHHNEL